MQSIVFQNQSLRSGSGQGMPGVEPETISEAELVPHDEGLGLDSENIRESLDDEQKAIFDRSISVV